ncbi:MAG: class I adenylate-forming enzyme family protein [Thermodesulfobacteriota bacterium]
MIKDILKSNARRYPDKTAIIFKDTRYTYREFNDRINRLANGLVNSGLRKGDWIAIVTDDCIQQVEIFWAGAKTGIVSSILNPGISDRDLSHIIGNGNASAVVCSYKYKDKIESLRPQLGSVKEFILFGASGGKGFKSYDSLISSSSPQEPEAEISEDDLLYFANTSGTTGLPKQVMHTYKSLLATALMDLNALNYDIRAGNVFLVAAPLFWGYMIARTSIPPFYAGCPLVIPPDFTPEGLLEIIQRERVTNILTGTAFFQPIIDYPGLEKYDCSSLRNIFTYGYFPPEIWQKAIELFGRIFLLGYGLSEIGLISLLPPDDFIFEGPQEKVKRVRSCGKEGFCVEARVINDQGEDVKPGEVGEVIAKADSLMKGYWNNPQATGQTIRNDYIYTGDLATIDEDGYIFLVGRKKDSITTQGKMLLPLEIEEVILQHPQVLEVAVIGVPDKQLGEAVTAIVVKRNGDITEEEIIELCRGKLPDYAVPRSVDFVESLPKTGSGRVQRYKLRERYL